MNTRERIAWYLYMIAALASIVMGLIYLSSSQFMPYHAEAIGIAWSEMENGLRVLFLAGLRLGGAGFVSVGIALIAMLYFPFREGERWVRWAIPAVGLAFWGPVLYVTVTVTCKTPASAPWYGALIVVLFMLAGCILSARGVSGVDD